MIEANFLKNNLDVTAKYEDWIDSIDVKLK